jgi:hypothetical protein
VVALAAATGKERWHFRVPGGDRRFGGAAVRASGVTVLVGDVEVDLDTATGTVVGRHLLPGGPEADFAFLGAEGRQPVVRHGDLVQRDDGRVFALDRRGARLVERPPASTCRYAALHPFDSPTILVRDGRCGPIELVTVIGDRYAVRDVPLAADGCPQECRALAGGETPRTAQVLLRLYPGGRARIFDGTSLGPAIDVAAGDVTLLPTYDERGDAYTSRLVVESYRKEDGAVVVDQDGAKVDPIGPLPGSPTHSVVTPAGWYRFRAIASGTGVVEVLDVRTLRRGRPGPELPCSSIHDMSAANGRLLVDCGHGMLRVLGR